MIEIKSLRAERSNQNHGFALHETQGGRKRCELEETSGTATRQQREKEKSCKHPSDRFSARWSLS